MYNITRRDVQNHMPLSSTNIAFSLIPFDEVICCSRRAALLFAKGSAVVREEQRGRSRTVNNFAL